MRKLGFMRWSQLPDASSLPESCLVQAGKMLPDNSDLDQLRPGLLVFAWWPITRIVKVAPSATPPSCVSLRQPSLEIVSRGFGYGMLVLHKCTGWSDDYVSCVRGGHGTGRGQLRWRDSVPSSVSRPPRSASTSDSPTNSPYRSGRQPRVSTRRS